MSDRETNNMGKTDGEKSYEDKDRLPDIEEDQSVENKPDATGGYFFTDSICHRI